MPSLSDEIQNLFEVFMVDSGDTPLARRYASDRTGLIYVYAPPCESVLRLLRMGDLASFEHGYNDVVESARGVLDAVGAHLSNAQIADRLHISVRTVGPAAVRMARNERRTFPAPKPSGEIKDKAFVPCGGGGLTANLEGVGNQTRFPGGQAGTMHPEGWEEQVAMSTSMVPVLGSLSFWRIEDVPFETYVAALDSWLRTSHGGELRFGGSQLLGPMEHDRDLGTRRIQVHLARGPLHPLLRMRLDIDRWSSSSTALELIPCRLVRPTVDYFQAGRLLLDSLTRSLRQRPEPWVTPSIAA